MQKIVVMLLFFFFIIGTVPLFPATMYAFIFANTEDEGIGCIYDVENVAAFLAGIPKETGLTVKLRIRMNMANVERDVLTRLKKTGEVIEGWTKDALDKEIKSLTLAKDDVVFFYYSGHGGRMSSKKNTWPDMALEKGHLLDMKSVVDTVKKKAVQPRLLIVFGDCCNSYMDRSLALPARSVKSTTSLKKLFLESTGVIIASGSEPGQYSLGGSDGGVFTNACLKEAVNPSNTDWESVLSAARSLASRNSGGEQFPQYEINGKLASSNVNDLVPDNVLPDDPLSDEDLPIGPGFLEIVNGKASGQRKPALNSKYPFTELSRASLDGSGSDLVITLELAKLPAKLTFYDTNVPDNYLEYEWAATIDTDGNGTMDYMVSLSNFKFEGKKKEQGKPLDMCQSSIWLLEESGGTALDQSPDVTVKGNAIVFTVADYRELFELAPGAAVYFSSLYYLGGESFIP